MITQAGTDQTDDQSSYLYNLLRDLGLSDFAAETVQAVFIRPLKSILILLVAFILARIAARLTRRLVMQVHRKSPLLVTSVRAETRAKTLGDTAAGVVKVIVYAIAILMVFETLGVNIGPILAGAGILGVALGFGAQTVVRDFLAGFFILVEDQYGVGDVITLNNEVTGTVEEVALQYTRLRSVDGVVHYVPNGEIRLTSNTSMEWSKALLDVAILPTNDVTRALEVFDQAVAKVVSSDEFSDVVTGEPEILGVDSVTREGVVLRAAVKTTPADQYRLLRALRQSVISAFREQGIQLPTTTVTIDSGES